MRAEGINKVGRVIKLRFLKARIHAFGQIPGEGRHQRHILNRLELVGRAFDREFAIGILDIFDRGFHQMRRQGLGFVFELARGFGQRRPRHGSRAAAIGAPAHRRFGGIAMNDFDIFHWEAEFVADDLRQSRFRALAMGRCAYQGLHLAGGRHADNRAFPKAALKANRPGNLTGAQAAHFGISGHADAQITAVLAGFGLFFAEGRITRDAKRFFEGRWIVAAVIDEAGGDFVAVFEFRYQIFPPQFNRIHVQFIGDHVHHSLQQEGRFGSAGAAVRIGGSGRGHHANRFAVSAGYRVRPHIQQAVQDGRDAGRGSR